MDDKIVIGGKAKLRNVIKGNTSLQNLLNGSPGVVIRTVGGKGGISDAVKEALLDCFEHVAWIDDDGQVYYQALYDALYAKELVSISAVFNQGQAVIYDNDSLDDLKQYLTVTATYDDATTETVASTGYTLSGTLNPGTSTISVAYEGKMAYFNVTVTHMPGTVTITNTLTGCTNSNSASSATEGDSYSGTISASSGYTLTGATVSITMGGVDITSTAYNNGTISIAEVTGSLVITITAVAVTLVSISAVYTQSGTVYDTDSLDSLKAGLVVTATYSDSSTATVPSADYTLSGTLAEGTSTITVSYGGKTTTFTVTVTAEPILPADYQQVEYVESLSPSTTTGCVTIDATLAGSGDVEIEMSIMPLAKPSSNGYFFNVSATANANNVGIGIYTDSSVPSTINLLSSDTGAITINPKDGSSILNDVYDITATVTSTTATLSDGTHTATESKSPRTRSGKISVFGIRKYSNTQYNNVVAGRVYSLTLTEAGVKKIDLIPCYRKSDNAVGFYNTVTEVFNTNSGLTAGGNV